MNSSEDQNEDLRRLSKRTSKSLRPGNSLFASVLVVVLYLLSSSSSPYPAVQQERTITGIIEGKGYTRVKIAIPGLYSDPVCSAYQDELRKTIIDDLAYSGYFEPLSEYHLTLVSQFSESNPNLKEWNAVGADVTVIGRMKRSGDKLLVEARLFDTRSEKMILGRSYSGSPDIVRRIAHKMADDIILHFTGVNGLGLTRIAFSSKAGNAKEIYVMDYDGHRIRRLTRNGTISLCPAWPPGGDKLAFISFREGVAGIFIINSSGEIVASRSKKGDLNSAPDWSPDGNTIVFSSNEAGNSEIYKWDLKRGKVERLSFCAAIDSSPCWSPTGREVVFTSDRSGSPQLYIMDAEGTNVRRITFDGNYNDSAAWSPRGDKIAYASRKDGRFDICIYDLNSGTSVPLTGNSGNNENPRWSPDGRHLVFASSRTGSYNIFSMNMDGSDLKQLTFSGNCFTPDWSK
ncbi:MAG: Tol-Pal system beta propeller repeat protein TolB [Acidobacteriota bacterium]